MHRDRSTTAHGAAFMLKKQRQYMKSGVLTRPCVMGTGRFVAYSYGSLGTAVLPYA